MLDTIIMTIPLNQCFIQFDNFKPSLEFLKNSLSGFMKCVNNPTKQDWESGIYRPRLTAMKRGSFLLLKIEFSAPKLLFGNNLDEIREEDFSELIKILQGRMRSMGISAYTHNLDRAEIISFHPSKNIPLTGGYTSSFVIRELMKADISKVFDIEEVKFRNNGQSLQIYANSNSVVFYDKMNDLTRPAKRAIDKDQTAQQKSIFEEIKKRKNPLEILRMEVRLSDKKKMNDILEKVSYPVNPTFKDIFRKDLCQKVVNFYWQNLFADNLFLFDINKDYQQLLSMILAKNPTVKIKQAIFLLGLILACRDDDGVRGLRNIVESYKPKTNWTALKRELQRFRESLPVGNYEFIGDIERELGEFRAFKVKE